MAEMSAFDETGNIGNHESAVAFETHNAEVGLECRKWIVRDLRLCGGDSRYERRFPCIWESHKSDIGEQLELQAQIDFIAGTPRLMLGRRLMRRSGESRIAPAAASASGNDIRLSRHCEVDELVAGIAIV